MANINSECYEEMKTRDILNYSVILSSFELTLESIDHLQTLFELYSDFFKKESEKLKEDKIEPPADYPIIIDLINKMGKGEIENIKEELKKISPQSNKSFMKVLELYRNKIHTESFLRKMIITHLITMFEDFLKKILKLAFLNKPDMLKTNTDNNLTYEEIIELQNYDLILEEMIERKTNSIIKKDINEIGKQLNDFFKFDLINHRDWNKFTEVFYRRHVIVHNKGISDEEYSKHTGNTPNQDLFPDDKYIKESLMVFNNFAKKITKFFQEKYPDPK